MKLPLKKIKLGFKTFNVRSFIQSEDPNYLGFMYWNNSEITLNMNKFNNETEVLNTLLHEILHGIFRDKAIRVPDDEEEYLVGCISHGLTEALVRNKALGKYLYETTN